VALRSGTVSRTYRDLDLMVDRLTSAFVELGVREGDRVAILMGNSIEMIEILLATNRMGAIAVPINFRLVANEVRNLVLDSGAVAIVTDVERAEVAKGARATLGASLPCVVKRTDKTSAMSASDIAGPGSLWLDEAIARATTSPVEAKVTNESPALIMYTSGTTGRPKGAVLSHQNLLFQTFNYITASQLFNDDAVFMCSVPIFHIAAIGALVPMLTLGGTCVVMPSDSFDPVRLVDVIEAEGVTDIFLVPTQWQAVCAVPGLTSRNFRLRSMGWGASTTTRETLESMATCFPNARIVALFGQTEMSPVTCALRGDESLRKLGSVGRPVSSVDVRIVDDDMNDVPEGDVGEIVYRGPNLMAGYWNNPEANEEAFRGGWFHSGDLVRRDDEGFIYVVDRKKDVIVSGGENVYCAEVEQAVASYPGVAEVAVIGAPHRKWVETPVAYVVPLDPGAPPQSGDIIAWCRDWLASFKLPSEIIIIDVLPRNASGKVVKGTLRDDYATRNER